MYDGAAKTLRPATVAVPDAYCEDSFVRMRMFVLVPLRVIITVLVIMPMGIVVCISAPIPMIMGMFVLVVMIMGMIMGMRHGGLIPLMRPDADAGAPESRQVSQ